jgi:hypothetical protein
MAHPRDMRDNRLQPSDTYRQIYLRSPEADHFALRIEFTKVFMSMNCEDLSLRPWVIRQTPTCVLSPRIRNPGQIGSCVSEISRWCIGYLYIIHFSGRFIEVFRNRLLYDCAANVNSCTSQFILHNSLRLTFAQNYRNTHRTSCDGEGFARPKDFMRPRKWH